MPELRQGAFLGTSSPVPAVHMEGMTKSFGPVKANQNITLTVPSGSIHAVVGENGAGKSTLMSILYGLYTADAGQIRIAGRLAKITCSADAIKLGIGMVHQHFMLIPVFSVLENMILGSEGERILISPAKRKARQTLAKLAEEYGLYVDPDALVNELPVGIQQRVEILKTLYRGAKVLILDEPTSVLTPLEADQLFDILRSMRAQGNTVILITHKLREVMAVSDNVTIMRGGRKIADRPTTDTSPAELAELMVGRKVLLQVTKKPIETGEVLLSATDLSVADQNGRPAVRKVNLELRAKEIVGIAGVSGNGQSELLDALAGILPLQEGSLSIGGELFTPTRPTNPSQIRSLGSAHIPEDRQGRGLVLSFPAEDCLLLGHHHDKRFLTNHMINRSKVRSHANLMMPRFDIRPTNPELLSAKFSGGNQQKIVLAREIGTQSPVFLIGQPTRGVDIGAIEAIHRNLIALRDNGAAILLFSYELEEVMSLADRIIVMCGGRITGEIQAADADEKSLGLMMADSSTT